MNFKLSKFKKTIAIHCKDEIVYSVSDGFLSFTGYDDDEIIGISIDSLSTLLKFDYQFCLKTIDSISNCYLFTKQHKPVEVNISSEYIIDKKQKNYYIEEVCDFSLDNMLKNIFSNNNDDKKSLALYSIDGPILIQSNKQYVDVISSLNMSEKDLIARPPISQDLILDFNSCESGIIKKEVEFINRDNSTIYFDLSTFPLYINNEKKYLLNIIYDVTDRVLTRINLNKQKEILETILDQVSDKIGIINANGDYTYKNKAARDIIKTITNKNDPNDTSNNTQQLYSNIRLYDMDGIEIPFNSMPNQKVLKGESFSDYLALGVTHNATQYNKTSGIPLYDEEGKLSRGVLIHKDVTHEILLEEYKSFKEKTQNSFLNYAILSYPDFNILYINDDAYNTLQNSDSSIKNKLYFIGKNFFQFIGISKTEEINTINNIKNFIEQALSSYVYVQKIVTNNKDKYIKTIFQPVYDEDKKVSKINILGIDITAEKEANEKMSKALKTQDIAFENTSHELRTPLNLISSASQLLNTCLKMDTPNKEMISTNEIIIKNTYRLIKLINNILDSTKLKHGFEKLDLENIDIVYITEDIIESISLYVKEKGLKIVFDTDVEEKIIALDLYKFEKIILNLISNAIKCSNFGDVIFINLYDKDTYIELSIEDQGIGIDEENLNKIFNKFYQIDNSSYRSSEGTGIGLSLVKSLVKLHNGEINVESILNKGTKFTLKFPSMLLNKDNINNRSLDTQDRDEIINIELSDI